MNLQQGDCLDLMQHIPDASIDAIITDPPYDVTACKWDVVVPMDAMWEAFKRVIKPNGAIVIFGMQPFTSRLVLSNPKWFKYDWCWRKLGITGHLNAKKQPLRDKEDILVFYSQQCTYNPQMETGKPYKARGTASDKGRCYGNYGPTRNDNHGTRYPRQTITFSNSVKTGVHPTQKPLDLLEYLVKTYTNPGETVLDPFMGSGTTGVACVNTGRNFIGFELDENYFEIATRRIIEAREINP